jgi:type II secretory pathway pseudopilin PulG
MLIATFGPTTAWFGNTISYQDGRLILEGHGPVPPSAVLEYDRQGHLTWAEAGLREWVQELAQSKQPPRRSRVTMPAWLMVAILCAVVLLVAGLLAAIAIPAFQNQRHKTRVVSVKEGIRTIQAGLEAFAVEHDDAYPDQTAVTSSGLRRYVDPWPINPYTGRPMTQSRDAGDFQYTVYDDGFSFDLTGYVADDTAVIVVRRVAVTPAHAEAIEQGIHSIQVGIESYRIDHDGALPDTTLVNPTGLRGYVDVWPANPYTGSPMVQSPSEGNFTYSVSAERSSFELTGYGDDGVVMIRVP